MKGVHAILVDGGIAASGDVQCASAVAGVAARSLSLLRRRHGSAVDRGSGLDVRGRLGTVSSCSGLGEV